jgi:propanediol dehydratase small subunit
MFAPTQAALVADLRFALEVMEDRSHLGLNAERAASLKTVMERRISVIEEALRKLPEASQKPREN